MESKYKDWTVRYYDKNNKLISSHTIKDRLEQEAEKEAIADMPYDCDDWSLTIKKPKPHYYVIWIEGFEYRNGEKIKSIHNNSIQYTTKITEAMRILPKDIDEMKSILLNMGIAKWCVESPNTFVKTSYAPKGSILKL
ncbi:MAG: hypothetical protein M0R03_15485 [Novosphingobium sp.]|nr:hypothetical protein [Novosphingobium sp.]